MHCGVPRSAGALRGVMGDRAGSGCPVKPSGIDGYPDVVTIARDDPENGLLLDHANQAG